MHPMIMPLQKLYLYCHVRLPCLGAMRNRYYSTVLLVVPNAVHFRSSAREALGFGGPVPRTSKSEPRASRNFHVRRSPRVCQSTDCRCSIEVSWLTLLLTIARSIKRLSLYPADGPKPVAITGDGNCLYRCMSLLATGDEKLCHVDLRR